MRPDLYLAYTIEGINQYEAEDTNIHLLAGPAKAEEGVCIV